MRFLLINYFSPTQYDKFSCFKKMFVRKFSKVFRVLDTDFKVVEAAHFEALGRFTYRNKQNYSRGILKTLNNFKAIDAVLIGGTLQMTCSLTAVGNRKEYPWNPSNKKILEVIKMCRDSGKPLLVLGSALYSVMFLASVEFKLLDFFDVKRISVSEAMSMDFNHFYARFCTPDGHVNGRALDCSYSSGKTRKAKVDWSKVVNRALVDPASGDLFFYDCFRGRWKGLYNSGFHNVPRQNDLQGFEVNFHKCFKLPHRNKALQSGYCADALWDKMAFRSCSRSHFMRRGIPKGADCNPRHSVREKMPTISVPLEHFQPSQEMRIQNIGSFR